MHQKYGKTACFDFLWRNYLEEQQTNKSCGWPESQDDEFVQAIQKEAWKVPQEVGMC